MIIKSFKDLKIGVLGGGQLGRMLQQEASTMGLDLHFLDQSKAFPAGQLAHNFIQGDFKNYDDVVAFGSTMDIITIEIENVNAEALSYLESKGVTVYPQAKVIHLIKDKGLQKQFYKDHNIATSAFDLYADKTAILEAIQNQNIHFPFVQKSRLAGYDGKGVAVIKSEDDMGKIMDVPSVIEYFVDIDKELAIIIARNQNGDINAFPVTEMVFNEEGNLLDYLICPSSVSEDVQLECERIAKEIITKMEMVGLLAVELFLTKKGEVIVNEVAPRPHNSGHHTIDANVNSQFNLHLRSILGLSLGDTSMLKPAVMINVLGEKGHTGPADYKGLEEVLKIDGVFPHLYGKKMVKPLRKMGHLTILAGDISDALYKMSQVKSKLKVEACQIKQKA